MLNLGLDKIQYPISPYTRPGNIRLLTRSGYIDTFEYMNMKTEENNIVKIAKALSDKTRIRILKEIAAKGSISCGDAEKVVDLSQPTVSHHIKILSDAGLLNTIKDGRHVIVSVNKKALEAFSKSLSDSIKSK
jgi:ArsR family transcriptional regulator, arsenate/arsenite/antimonite-responsive transcriptional repressor